MMATWLDAAGIQGRYGVLEVPPERFDALADGLAELGLVGVNVTLPHKKAAFAAARTASDAARSVGAANRLTVTSQGLYAHNTDVEGVAAALADDPGAGPAVLIGAGGAARAALHCLKQRDREIRIVNRTRARAERIASELGVDAVIYTEPADALAGAVLVINATSLGMSGKTAFAPDFSACASNALAFDMVYTPLRTGFLTAAAQSGLRTVDGLTMLIGQARASFEAFYRAAPGPDSLVRPILEARLEGRA
jgi:shikimate dehydrogenase